MIDPRKFKAPFIPKERIWAEADRVRSECTGGRLLPLAVLDIAEFDLGLELVPAAGLREQVDIEALLLGDLRTILVDKNLFFSPRLEYRLRFSVAHEIGHFILHRDIYGGQRGLSAKEWFDCISTIPEAEYSWVEWHAYEFAGRLLVPPHRLREDFDAAVKLARASDYSDWQAADEAALDFISTRIAPTFGVSAEVIARRLRSEKLWPPP